MLIPQRRGVQAELEKAARQLAKCNRGDTIALTSEALDITRSRLLEQRRVARGMRGK